MSTSFTNLLTVDLPGRWDHCIVSVDNNDDGEGNLQPVLHTEVTAPDAQTAEARSLAVVDYDYEDDLRGAVATATGNTGDRWSVDITLRGYR